MRILFVKTSSLGDVIHQCPAVSDVRRRYPAAGIDWIVEEAFAGIASMHPAVRRVIPVAVRRWRKRPFAASTWREALAFWRALREHRYDFVIDTQGLLKSALIAAGARGTRYGFDAASAREPVASRFYNVTHAVRKDMHAVERNRMLTAASLGMYAPSEPCEYGLIPGAAGPATPAKPYCVLLSMTSRADKLWPDGHWVELVRAQAARGCESLLPWGSEVERIRSARIVAAAGVGVLPERLSLSELAGLISEAEVAIGVDTGLTHMAVALGVPAIGIYCASEPSLTGLHGDTRTVNLGGPGCVPAVQDVLAALQALA